MDVFDSDVKCDSHWPFFVSLTLSAGKASG